MIRRLVVLVLLAALLASADTVASSPVPDRQGAPARFAREALESLRARAARMRGDLPLSCLGPDGTIREVDRFLVIALSDDSLARLLSGICDVRELPDPRLP